MTQSQIGAGYFQLSYSPNGKIIAISGVGGIKLFSDETQSYFTELPINYKYENSNQVELPGFIDVQYSADGQKLVVIDKYHYYADIWDWQKGGKIRINYGDFTEAEILNSVFTSGNFFEKALFANVTPDGKFIIIVTNEGIKKLDLEGNLISELKTNANSEILLQTHLAGEKQVAGRTLTDVNYSSNLDGSKIATIGVNLNNFQEILRLWDFSTQQVKQFKNNSLPRFLTQVLVSPNGKYIFTISSARGQLWDSSGNLLNSLDINAQSSLKGEEASILAALPSGEKEQVMFHGSGVRILEVWQNSKAMEAGLRTDDIILEIDGHKVDDFQEVRDFVQLLRGEAGTPVKIKFQNRNYEIEEKTIIREKVILDASDLDLFLGNRAKFSLDSEYLATWGSGNKNLSLRNINTNKLVEINNQAGILDVNFSPDFKLFATMGMDYSIKIWDFSGKLINQIKFQQIPVHIAFSPDSQQIAVIGDSGEISIWSIDGKQIAKYAGNEDGEIVFSPDGKHIATGASKVRIWPNKNLNELLATGCNWLKEYLATRPEEKARLKVCQDNPDLQ